MARFTVQLLLRSCLDVLLKLVIKVAFTRCNPMYNPVVQPVVQKVKKNIDCLSVIAYMAQSLRCFEIRQMTGRIANTRCWTSCPNAATAFCNDTINGANMVS